MKNNWTIWAQEQVQVQAEQVFEVNEPDYDKPARKGTVEWYMDRKAEEMSKPGYKFVTKGEPIDRTGRRESVRRAYGVYDAVAEWRDSYSMGIYAENRGYKGLI